MIDVLLADDQELVRTGFRMILESEPGIKVVGEATTGREALTLSARLRPAVVLMDIRMPELDGLHQTARTCAEIGQHLLLNSDSATPYRRPQHADQVDRAADQRS